MADPLHGGEEFVRDALGLVPLSGQIEGAGRYVEDGGAVLDNAEVAHLLARPHVSHLNPLDASRAGTSMVPQDGRRR